MAYILREELGAECDFYVEDTPWTLEQLAKEGFPAPVIEAVEALTKRKGKTRLVAAARAARNLIARAAINPS